MRRGRNRHEVDGERSEHREPFHQKLRGSRAESGRTVHIPPFIRSKPSKSTPQQDNVGVRRRSSRRTLDVPRLDQFIVLQRYIEDSRTSKRQFRKRVIRYRSSFGAKMPWRIDMRSDVIAGSEVEGIAGVALAERVNLSQFRFGQRGIERSVLRE